NYGLILQDYDSWDKVVVASADTANPPRLKVFYSTVAGAFFETIDASEDTMITYQPPNYEGWGLGFSGRPDGSTASLIRWDLRAIPRDGQVIYAGMDVTVNRLPSSDAGKPPFLMYPALVPWTEKANWSNYDGVTPWSAPGAYGAGDRDASVDSLSCI